MSLWRRVFGPSQEEVWSQLAAELGGQLETGWWHGTRVHARAGDWTTVLEQFIVPAGKVMIPYTRLRAPYRAPNGFRFSIRREHFFDRLGKWMVGDDIEVGHDLFDRTFLIKGSDEERVRELLNDPALREALLGQTDLTLYVQQNEGWLGERLEVGIQELRLDVPGTITDLPQLRAWYELFALAMNRLQQMGYAEQHGGA